MISLSKLTKIRDKLEQNIVKYEGTKKYNYYNEALAMLNGFDAATAIHTEREKILMSVIEKMKDNLGHIAEEQKFYFKDKDYFSEVVRLNLTARETLEEVSKTMEILND